MDNTKKDKWYFKTYVLVIAFLCVGPFAMPLAWFNPRFSLTKKIFASLIMLALTYLLGLLLAGSIKSILDYYQTLSREMR